LLLVVATFKITYAKANVPSISARSAGEFEAKNRSKLKMYFLDNFKETYDSLASNIEETSSI